MIFIPFERKETMYPLLQGEKNYIVPSGWDAPFGYKHSCDYWIGQYNKEGIPVVRFRGKYVSARAWRLFQRGLRSDPYGVVEMGCGHERCVSIEHMIR